MGELLLLFSWRGLWMATLTIVATTLDDCVWLIPILLGNPSSSWAGIGAVFVTTLVALSGVVCGFTLLLWDRLVLMLLFRSTSSDENNTSSNNNNANNDGVRRISQIGAAAIAWLLAGMFYYKSWSKQQRRTRQKEQQLENSITTPTATSPLVPLLPSDIGNRQQDGSNYGATTTSKTTKSSTLMHTTLALESAGTEEGQQYHNNTETPSSPVMATTTTTMLTLSQKDDAATITADTSASASSTRPIWTVWTTVASLTLLGFVDEVSYFPALIVGRVFTVAELLLGTVVSATILWTTVMAILLALPITTTPLPSSSSSSASHQHQQIQRPWVLEWIDKYIPLYGVITVYALVLTVQAVMEEVGR